ncbi:MAG: hypothetical protein V3R87_03050 [Dehalococcoidia bacterium]
MTKRKQKRKAHSGNKGKQAEREVRDLIRKHGFEARRGQQFSGGNGDPDVVHNMEGIHVEVKRREQLNLWEAMAQAKADAVRAMPTVWYRKNNKSWLVFLDADDFMELMKELHQ